MQKNRELTDLFWRHLSEGKQYAFRRFYDLYYNQVFRFAYYFLQDKEGCFNVVTEVFFSVWQSRKKLKNVDDIEKYLYVATRNEAFRYKKRIKQKYVSIEEIPVHIERSTDETVEEVIYIKELESLLTKAINELPEKCRQIFLMSRQEYFKTKEIAEILSIKESTVRVQIKIAIEKIISQIKIYYPDIFFFVVIFMLF